VKIYHCSECNVCYKLSDKERFHCLICGICFENQIPHECGSKNINKDEECCVCIEPLFFNIRQSVFLKCGHSIHKDCFDILMQKKEYKCPLCKKTMIDMDWDIYSLFLEMYKINERELVKLLCNDCLQYSENFFHPYGVQCLHCNSYNTAIER
jgi:RING finger/CHY zinc finger protein 1